MRTAEVQQQPFAACLDRLESIAALPEDWDSYGASRIAPVAVSAARTLLSDLAARPGTTRLLPFHIAPIATGGVQLEWKRTDGSALELWIDGAGNIDAVCDRVGAEPRIAEKRIANVAAAVEEIVTFVA
jgi:hypothetical protein